MHIKIIEDNDNDLIDNLILWRDALLNFIHISNHDFHLFIIITLLDFIIPKLSVIILNCFKAFFFLFFLFFCLFNFGF